MKSKLLFSIYALGFAATAHAQIGEVAPDFTVTDIDGNSHNLYSILDAGKVVVLDVSATWCGPCWGFHEGGYLEAINAQLGPEGTDQVRVMFYEGDASTTQNDLEGNTTSSQGDWITGATYPIINETPLQLDLTIFSPEGFPTINVINPSNKIIEGDLFYNQFESDPLQSMLDFLGEFTMAVELDENSSISESEIFLYPSPASENVVVDFRKLKTSADNMTITNSLGQTIMTKSFNGVLNTQIQVSNIENGIYFLNLNNGLQKLGVKRFLVQH